MDQHSFSSPAMYAEVNAQRYPLKLGQFYMFGRQMPISQLKDQENFIQVNEKDVDEKHCCVSDSVEDGVFVLDLLSQFGTFLNDNRIKPMKKTAIKHGDVMRLGSSQDVKIYNHQMETSLDSSGYGDTNKNTSDVICSSPETTSHRDSRAKHQNNNSGSNNSKDDSNKFLVPAVPAAVTDRCVRIVENKSFNDDIWSKDRSSLDNSNNQNRTSDSFTIPETQYCKPRTSTNSNLSVVESETDEGERSKPGYNFDPFVTDHEENDDFCIPETQDALLGHQMPCLLKDGPTKNALKTLEEKSVDLKDSGDEEEEDLDGSQFRICTQDYNEGFGEEDNNESMMNSQVIPLIKHQIIVRTGDNTKETAEKQHKGIASIDENLPPQEEEDKELANINLGTVTEKYEAKIIASTCSTPDLFEFAGFEVQRKSTNDERSIGGLFEDIDPVTLDDVEDFIATQAFPSKNTGDNKTEKSKLPKEKEVKSGKEDEPYLILSDKENVHPDKMEPDTDIPSIVPVTAKEALLVSPDCSTASTSSQRKSGLNQNEFKKIDSKVPVIPTVDIIPSSNKPMEIDDNLTASDDENNILTQPYLKPIKSSLSLSRIIAFNSTLIDGKTADKNPATFFADLETTCRSAVQRSPNEINVQKIPDQGSSASAPSKTSHLGACSDVDLLACTPQFIKDNLNKPDDIAKNKLAIKRKNLFDDDFEDDDKYEKMEDGNKSKDAGLVFMINAPIDYKDFNKLLPHLKKDNQTSPNKSDGQRCDQSPTGRDREEGMKYNNTLRKYIEIDEIDEKLKANDRNKKEMEIKGSTMNENKKHVPRNARSEKEIEMKSSKTKEYKKHEARSSSRRRTRHEDADKYMNTKDEEKSEQAKNSTNAKPEKDQIEKDEAFPKKKDKSIVSKKKEKNEEAKKNNEKSRKVSKEIKEKNEESGKERRNKKSKKSAKEIEDKNDETKKETTNDNVLASDDHKKEKSNKDEEKLEPRPRRGRKLAISTEKSEETKQISTDLPNVRRTRMKSTALNIKNLQKGSNAAESTKGELKLLETNQKNKRKSGPVSESSSAAGDEIDLLPTQPFKRNTRRTAQPKLSNDDAVFSASSKSALSHSSSSMNTSLNRSSSRLIVSTKSYGIEGADKAIIAKAPSASKSNMERKRKAEVDGTSKVEENPQVEEKRPRRKVSEDAKYTLSTPPVECLISMTMVDPVKFQELSLSANGLWTVAEDPAESSILVMDKAFRTYKFLLAMARGIPIVRSEWLQKVNAAKSLTKVSMEDYLFNDDVFEKTHKFSFIKSLKMARENERRIFQGLTFMLTSKIKPQPKEMQAIITYAGGSILHNPPGNLSENQKLYLVSSTDDRKEWHKYRRVNKNVIIISTEAVMTSVMRQNCLSLSKHLLS